MNTLVGARVYVHTLNVNISNGGKFAQSEKGEEGIPGQKEKCLPTAPHVNLFFSVQACHPGFTFFSRRFVFCFVVNQN